MKKILSVLLVLVFALTAFVGCDKIPGLDKVKLPGFLENIFGGNDDKTPSDETPEVDEDLQAAYDFVHQDAKNIPEQTIANYSVMVSVVVGDKTYSVKWEIVGTDAVVIDGSTVVIPEPADAPINYTLKFTVTNEKGETLTKEYNKVVPAFAYNTFEEYATAEDDTPLVLTGIVTGVISKSTGSSANGLYVQDLNNEGATMYTVSKRTYMKPLSPV